MPGFATSCSSNESEVSREAPDMPAWSGMETKGHDSQQAGLDEFMLSLMTLGNVTALAREWELRSS